MESNSYFVHDTMGFEESKVHSKVGGNRSEDVGKYFLLMLTNYGT